MIGSFEVILMDVQLLHNHKVHRSINSRFNRVSLEIILKIIMISPFIIEMSLSINLKPKNKSATVRV